MRNSESLSPTPSRIPQDQLWMVPYARNSSFSGREEELQTMAALLHDEQKEAGGLALCGAGGIGKTQLALEYAYLHREEYRSIFWVSAGTRETLHAAYSDIAELLDLPEKGLWEQRRLVEAVTRWLEANSAWLLILDDVGDPALCKAFLPAICSGHVLFTTRAHASGKLIRRIRVKALTLEQGSRLLLRKSGLWSASEDAAEPAAQADEAARTLAKQLNCLPLALNLAGAYLAETTCGLSDYHSRLRTLQTTLSSHNHASEAEESAGPLRQVVQLSCEKIAKTGSLAADLLSLCAFLAPDEIAESLLVACLPAFQKQNRRLLTNSAKRNAALTALQKYALLERDPEQQSLTIAREVQTTWRSLLPAGAEKVRAEQTVRAIGAIFASLDVDDWEACQRLLPHAQVCAAYIERWQLVPLEGAWLLHHMGWYLHTRGQYAEAQVYEERALTIYRAVVGDEHASTAMLLNNLAITYEDQGRLNDAATLHTQALAIRRSVLGEEHPETAASLHNLALIYHDQGKLEDAATFYRQALAIRLQLLGETHPDIATLRADLAGLSAAQGRFDDALVLYQQALAIRRKALGNRHPDTIALLNGLAATYQAQDKFAEAINWRQQALAAQRKTLGHEHPDLAATFGGLAAISQAQNKLDEAAFWLQQALAILNTLPLQVPLEQARALEILAIAYEEQEQHAKAEALYAQALTIYRRGAHESQLDLARCSYNLALLYHEHRRESEARPLLEQALTIWQERRGTNHPDTRKAREKYEQIAQKQKSPRAKREQPVEPGASTGEHSNPGALKGIARAIRRVGRKKT